MNEQNQTRLIVANSQAVKCAKCKLPSLEVRGGMLVIRNRHHGEMHENVFSLDWIRLQIERMSSDNLNVAA
ncbi:MAG: hypothetical protein SF097_04615 [Acidobacteriota bacterium]|nr:hypothetical protein [Acidobacteriota bacterium]